MSDSDVSMDDSSPQLRAAKSIAQTMLSKDAAIPGLDQVSVNNDLKLMTSTRTFAFRNEDHTLGNLVRYFLMKNPHVEAAGYNIPHPSENIMNLWVQTKAIGPAAIGSVEEVSPDMALEESRINFLCGFLCDIRRGFDVRVLFCVGCFTGLGRMCFVYSVWTGCDHWLCKKMICMMAAVVWHRGCGGARVLVDVGFVGYKVPVNSLQMSCSTIRYPPRF